MRRKLKRILITTLITPIALVVVGILLLFANISFQKPPYLLPDSPVVAYRITGEEGDIRYFADDPNSIHGYAIVQRREITDQQLQKDVVDLLNSRLIYGFENIMCFEPGIAIRLGKGSSQVDALICLHCQHIYFFRNGQIAYTSINTSGVGQIKAMYGRLFPGHSADESDPDTEGITAVRKQQRDKIEGPPDDASTKPATMPAGNEKL